MGRHSARKGRRVATSVEAPVPQAPEQLTQAYQAPPQPEQAPRMLPQDAEQLYKATAGLSANGQVEHLLVGREIDGEPRRLYLDAPLAIHVDSNTGVTQRLLGLVGRVHTRVLTPDQEPLTDYTTAWSIVHASVPTANGGVQEFLTVTDPSTVRPDKVTGEDRSAWNQTAVLTHGDSYKGEWQVGASGSVIQMQYDAINPQQAWEFPPHLRLTSTEGEVTLLQANRAHAPQNHEDTLGTMWMASPASLQRYAYSKAQA